MNKRTQELFDRDIAAVHRRTDRMFAFLLMGQWGLAIALSVALSPFTYEGLERSIHPHVFASVVVGGIFSVFPVILAVLRPGRQSTRYALATAQMLWSGLLIHLTGGRIETHFHIFGSLAFLAFYRDFKVLIPATIVTALDHMLRGFFWGESIYGVANPEWWRFLEHAGWVIFIDLFLIQNCRNARRELWHLSERQARTEEAEQSVRTAAQDLERRVRERTSELEDSIRAREAAQRKLNRKNRKAREAAEAHRRQLFRFLEEMPIGVFVVDANGSPVFANEEAVRMMGRQILPSGAEDEDYAVYLRGSEELCPEDELPVVRALRGDVVATDSFEIAREDSRTPVYAKACPIRDDRGNIAFALAAFEDITEKVRAETQRLQGQKLESVGQLAAGIAHEINTPMQYIGDNAEFLRKAFSNLSGMLDFYDQASLPEELSTEAARRKKSLKLKFVRKRAPKAIESTIEGVEAVSRIVRAMKEFSHPGSEEKTPTDLNRAVETTITVAKNEWKYVADVQTDFAANLPMVPCLPGELNQVLLNLVVNAAHAIESAPAERGVIRLSTKLSGNHAEISISDTGTGIPAKLVDKIFDPFFTTKAVGKGTGQGLAIARSIIVEKHGGEIHVDSEPGVGTTFRLLLPLADALQGAA